MNTPVVLLSVLVGLATATLQASVTETKARIGHYDVTIATERVQQTPPDCHAKLLAELGKAGWCNQIYNSRSEEKSFLIYSQRVMRGATIQRVTITLWKSLRVEGGTHNESWTYVLEPGAVNKFLDDELRLLVVRFKTAAPRAAAS